MDVSPQLQLFYDEARQAGFVLDEAQIKAATLLSQLYADLMIFKNKRANRLQKILSRQTPPKGLYLWGGVGRGKTWLMDIFYNHLPYRRKKRIHFHALMQDMDKRFRELPQGEDPMAIVATALAKSFRVICVDEMVIHNISDAMMFARLWHHLSQHGVVLVTTSNVPPNRLYEDGLHRDRFLPTIALIEKAVIVHQVDAPTDYRLLKLKEQNLWITPSPEDNQGDKTLIHFYHSLTHKTPQNTTIHVLDRAIKVRAVAEQEGVIWCDCAELCGQGRTFDDYLELIQSFHTVILSGVPILSARNKDTVRRFIWLVDIVYDTRNKLIASSAVPIINLVADDLNMFESERTISRLLEMQSEVYRAQAHRAIDY